MRPKLLILSFTDISVDPRVMKQVRRFVGEYYVTTCGAGPTPHPDVREHLPLDLFFAQPRGRWGNLLDSAAREVEWFAWTYRQIPMVWQARRALDGREFDAVIANDADAVGVALAVAGPDRVHADLHEFFPGLPAADDKLGRRQTRYWTWLTRRFSARARSSTTVGWEIADRYRAYGLDAHVVTNATPYRDGEPSETGTPIRLVHSGNAFWDRGLAEIMRAVAATSVEVTLDLYLVRYNPTEWQPLFDLADELGDRITMHDPVPQAQLVDTLAQYDMGIHVLPPLSENSMLALPNKFFDFVQARLGIVVGPSAEMGRLVREHGLGVVADSFAEDAIRRAIESLTPENVDGFKRSSAAVADELSAERQVEGWASAVRRIVAAG